MTVRSLIAAGIGVAVGFAQSIYLLSNEEWPIGGSGAESSAMFQVTTAAWAIEILALIVLATYRIAPWIVWLLRDESEARRIARDKRIHVPVFEWLSSIAVVARAFMQGVEVVHITAPVVIGVAFGVIPQLIPRPRHRSVRERKLFSHERGGMDNHSPNPTGKPAAH